MTGDWRVTGKWGHEIREHRVPKKFGDEGKERDGLGGQGFWQVFLFACFKGERILIWFVDQTEGASREKKGMTD